MSDAPKLYRQHALRRGRHSQAHSRYFITFCARALSAPLSQPQISAAFHSELQKLEKEGALSEWSFTLMPDHTHLLFRLGEKLTLGQTIARLKAKTKMATKTRGIALDWQPGYYDHKLRNDEELHPTLHYLYMNPYRSKLVDPDEAWPYTRIAPKEWDWFRALLRDECPYPEWLTE